MFHHIYGQLQGKFSFGKFCQKVGIRSKRPTFPIFLFWRLPLSNYSFILVVFSFFNVQILYRNDLFYNKAFLSIKPFFAQLVQFRDSCNVFQLFNSSELLGERGGGGVCIIILMEENKALVLLVDKWTMNSHAKNVFGDMVVNFNPCFGPIANTIWSLCDLL